MLRLSCDIVGRQPSPRDGGPTSTTPSAPEGAGGDAVSGPTRYAAVCVLAALALGLGGCATELPGDAPELDAFEYPVGMAMHPSGKYLYVVNANFDLTFRPQDGGTLMVVDTETGAIIPEATRTLGSFGTAVVLNHDATRGYIAVRGDHTITWFGLSEDGSSLFCPLTPSSRSLERCRFSVPEEPTGLAYARSERSQPLVDADGNPQLDGNGDPVVIEPKFDVLAIAHLRNGMVSIATVVDPPTPSAEPAFSVASAALVDGPTDVTWYAGERFLVTGRAANSVVGFRPAIGQDARVLGLFTDSVLPVPTPFSSHRGRSLLLSDDRERLYMTNQSPNSLLVFDLSAGDNDTVTGQRNRIIGMIDMPAGPNRMVWLPRENGSPLLYVTSFGEDSLTLVDVDLMAVVGTLPVGRGPFDLVTDVTGAGRLYVTNFSDDTISIVNVEDPAAPLPADVIGTPQKR